MVLEKIKQPNDIKNLTEFEFGKELLMIRKEYTEDETTIRQLEYIKNLYDLSNKEVTEILEEYEDPSNDFEAKLSRSMKYNKNKSVAAKARIFGKHCKKNSTENKEKRVNVRRMHIYKILRSFNFKKILKKSKRIVIILDNAKAHKTDMIYAIADSLNIYLVPTPPYTPRLNPTEKVWDIEKRGLKRVTLETREDIVTEAENIFEEKCCGKSLTEKYAQKYIPNIC